MPLAVSVVPSIGSTATSHSGPVPSPTSSPLNSIGALSFSPSPITTTPFIWTVAIILRIASTATPSAPSLSPRPTQRAAARAAASVTRTSSNARLRSGASGKASDPPDVAVMRGAYRRSSGVAAHRGLLHREPHLAARGQAELGHRRGSHVREEAVLPGHQQAYGVAMGREARDRPRPAVTGRPRRLRERDRDCARTEGEEAVTLGQHVQADQARHVTGQRARRHLPRPSHLDQPPLVEHPDDV